MKLVFTPARSRALDVLVKADAENRSAYISNTTDAENRHVYWQTGDWLVKHGLAEMVPPGAGSTFIQLTDLGREVARG